MTTETTTSAAAVPLTEGIAALAGITCAFAAAWYASRGFRVVPLHNVEGGVCSCDRGADCGGAGKHPRVKSWQTAASDDLEVVSEWWRRWPRANVGLAMGGPERIIALDVDGAEGRASLAKLEQLYFALPETLTSRSGRPDGGEHRLFRLAPHHDLDAIKNNAGRIGMKRGAKKTDPRPFPALDIRGDGGQIVVCPSIHKSGHPYTWTNEAPIAELPKWLYELLVPPPEVAPEAPAAAASPAVAQHDAHDKYATVALERACDEVRTAPKGTRNDTINREAYSIGTLVGAGLIRHADAEARLLDAMRAGGWDAVAIRTLHTATLRRALNDGARSPRVIPELPQRPYQGSPAAVRIEPKDRWTALEALLEELAQVPEEARNERALERPCLDAVLAIIESDRTPEGARLVERLKALGIKVNPWKMALRSRRKEQIDEQTAAAPPPENEEQPKRSIVVRPGELGNLVRQAMTLLRDDSNVYVRDGQLVTVVPSDGPDAAPKISMLQPETVRVLLADAAKWIEPVGDGPLMPTDPPMPVVAGVCADPNKKDVRRLDAVVEAPTLGPRGELVESDGYHELTRLVMLPSRSFPRVPESPTRDDACEALRALQEVFQDFDHETDVDRSIPLAALLTLIARPAIKGPVPGFGFSANSKGTGKSRQVKSIIAIAVGREAEDTGWTDDDAELTKKLDTAALAGSQYVWFDNLESVFGGSSLAAYLTNTQVRPRVLGQSKAISCPWRGVIMPTGNNLRLGRDIDRRVLVSRILSRHERPWLRPESDFAHPRVESWALEHHPRLLVAGLTLLRAWIIAKRPAGSCPTYGSFEAWSRFVPDALEWAGAANPLRRATDAPEENETDEDRALRVVLGGLRRLDPSCAGMKVADVIGVLYPMGRPPRRDDGPPDGFAELREALESVVKGRTSTGVPQPVSVGKWFARNEHRAMGGVWLHQEWAHGHVARWKVVPVPSATIDDIEALEREAIQAAQ